jgi:endogenous inhibitor of DNA gyrase (YacG/DUF329 family)
MAVRPRRTTAIPFFRQARELDHGAMTEVPSAIACPTCRRPVSLGAARPPTFPFCGARCRTIDLGAWATGGHVIPGTPLSLEGNDADLDRLLDRSESSRRRQDPDYS